MAVFVSFLISFLLFLYAALSPVLDFTIDPDFNVLAWGFVFMTLGFLLPEVVSYRGRRNR